MKNILSEFYEVILLLIKRLRFSMVKYSRQPAEPTKCKYQLNHRSNFNKITLNKTFLHNLSKRVIK